MKERIKEIIEQAHLVADATYARGPDSVWEREYNKKFAELIVKECAHLVGGYTKENEFGTDVKEAYEEITKHFGVE